MTRFYIVDAAWASWPLDPSFRPEALRPGVTAPNLARARNSDEWFDLADDRAAPALMQLKGRLIDYPTEDALEAELRMLAAGVKTARVLVRGARGGLPVSRGYLVGSAVADGPSWLADVSIFFVPKGPAFKGPDGLEVFF